MKNKRGFRKRGIFLIGILMLFSINLLSAELNYTTGEAVYGAMSDGSTTNFLNLTFQFTICTSSDCSDANFSTVYTNASFSNLSSLANASYFQYKATFFTENQNYTPYLFNVTVDYTYLDETSPLIDFVSPTPSNNSGASGQFEINLSVTEEYPANMSYNWNGTNITIPILDSLDLMLNFDNVSALGENDTYVVDASRQKYEGVVKGGAVWNNTGKYSGAFEFDGIDDSININQRIQCPAGMTYINKLNGFCIDKYEASVWNADGTWNSTSNTSTWNAAADTDQALSNGAYANSSEGVYPWVYIDQTEARTACANHPDGKYLCTDEQWLAAANIKGVMFSLAATLTDCTVDENTDCDWADSPGAGDACMTGSKTDCVSSEGVYDMTGNVWELTNETVGYTKPCNTGSSGWCYYNGTGFQTGTDANTAVYGNDGVYFLANTVSGYAVLRGGYWSSGASAGPFCAILDYAPSATAYYIGFRCCSS